jgi:hypothetical protein
MNNRSIMHAALTRKPGLGADDLDAAIQNAKPSEGFCASDQARVGALTEINWWLDQLISAQTESGNDDPSEIAQSLGAIALECQAIFNTFANRLSLDGNETADQTRVLQSLSRTLDPVIWAIAGAACGPDGMPKPEAELARLLFGLDQLADCCRRAQKQFEAGAQAIAANKSPPTNYARAFGFAVIQAYPALTGNNLAVSRGGSGPSEGKPVGPLIRFVTTIFERATAVVGADSRYAPLVKSMNLDPSSETIVSWVKLVKKFPSEPSPET